jgi:TolA-binding protein
LNNFRLLSTAAGSPLSDNCQYWLGECLYSQEKYHEAIDAFRKVQNLGDGNKADAALFKIGLSYLKLNRKNDARAAFNELEKNYPQSELVAKSRQYNLSQDKF